MNQLQDYRGDEITVSDRSALEKYETALEQLQCYHGDPVETVDEALKEDPDFVMAHCLRAHCGSAMADGQFSEHIRESLAALDSVTDQGNERERMHVAATRAWLEGRFKTSVEILESILVDYPRDVLALQIAHLSDFYLGDSHNLRDRVARVLPRYDESTPGYGYALGMYAFGLEECNEYARAEEIGRKAVGINPADVWGIHAVAHVLEMQGQQSEGIEWYTTREQDWAPDNGFAMHNWWHLSLYYLDLLQIDKVLEIYDNSLSESSVALEMLDASALLWRLQLMGEDTGDRWESLADKWEPTIEWGGYYCFNDCHAIMSFVATGRDQQANQMIEKMTQAAQNDNYSAWMVREVGLPVSHALRAFGSSDYGVAVDHLLKIRYTANRFGGSHAQRDIIAQTLIESAIRAGRLNQARALLSERAANKSTSPVTWRNTARVLESLQLKEEAETARRQVDILLTRQ